MAQNLWIPRELFPSPSEHPDRHDSPQLEKLQTVFSAFQSTGSSSSLALDVLLHDLAEEARSLPSASTAAIAIRGEGNHFVCRAAAGDSAPGLGTRIESQDGLSAECLRTGLPQVCQDTETDPRINAAMCRALSIRSLVILPLFLETNLVGILEVFAPVPHTLDRVSIKHLIDVGHRIVQTLAFAISQTQRGGLVREPERGAAQPTTPTRVAVPVIGASVPRDLPPPRSVEPEGPGSLGVGSLGHGSLGLDASQSSTRWVQESVAPATVRAARLDIPVPVFASGRAKFSATEFRPAKPDPTKLQRKKLRGNLVLALVALTTGLVAAVGLLWLPAVDPSLPLAATSSSGVVSGISAHVEAPRVSKAAKPSPSVPTSSTSVAPNLRPNAGAPSTPSQGAGGLVVYEKGKVVFREKPSSGVLVSPVTSAAETEKMEDTAAPSGPSGLFAPSRPSGASSASGAAEPSHAAPSAVTGGRLIRQVFPVVPPGIAGSEVSKDVILEGVVGRDGLVHEMHFVRGDQRLAVAAMEAVRQWRYEPFLSNGVPIDLPSTLEVHFR